MDPLPPQAGAKIREPIAGVGVGLSRTPRHPRMQSANEFTEACLCPATFCLVRLPSSFPPLPSSPATLPPASLALNVRYDTRCAPRCALTILVFSLFSGISLYRNARDDCVVTPGCIGKISLFGKTVEKSYVKFYETKSFAP